MKKPIKPEEKLDIEDLVHGLENYHPPRKGWTWRIKPADGVEMGPFHFKDMSTPLKKSIGLPASKYLILSILSPPAWLSRIASDDLKRAFAGCAWRLGMVLTI